jgi:serine/threonine protein kinase/formylglycine-generating enzyme required for sulfatase activity
MRYEKLFIQYALQLNYLQNSVVNDLLRRHGHSDVPDNIAQILLQEKLLTNHQADAIFSLLQHENLLESSSQEHESSHEEMTTADFLDVPSPRTDTPPSSSSRPTLPAAITSLKAGEVILDKYRILEKLGSGGMGVVYKVQHTVLEHNNIFALKMILPQYAADETIYKRFLREVELSMGLIHRNIITIREFGLLPNQAPYMVMDFVAGRTLQDILKDNWQCDVNHSLEIVRQVLEGLKEAHSRNIIHRDIKPANLIITGESENEKECVKILDFGLAKLMRQPGQDETVTHSVMGTPFYMSPEQIAGEEIDQRSDLYAVGLIFYEMVAGQKPFQSRNVLEAMYRQFNDPLPKPSQFIPSVPANVESIIMKAIMQDRASRYQTAQEFLNALPKAREQTSAIKEIGRKFKLARKIQQGEQLASPEKFPTYKIEKQEEKGSLSGKGVEEKRDVAAREEEAMSFLNDVEEKSEVAATEQRAISFAGVIFDDESSAESPSAEAKSEKRPNLPEPPVRKPLEDNAGKWQPILGNSETTPATKPDNIAHVVADIMAPPPIAGVKAMPRKEMPATAPQYVRPPLVLPSQMPPAGKKPPNPPNLRMPQKMVGSRPGKEVTVPKRRSRVLWLLLFLFLVPVAAGVLWFFFPELWPGRSQPSQNNARPTDPIDISPAKGNKGWFGEPMPEGMQKTQVRGDYVWEKDQSCMVYIAPGPFWRGDDNIGNDTEKPERQIILSAFYLDKYELTNEQYLKFMDATGHSDTPYLTESSFNDVLQPVVGLSWQDAQDYAEWAQKRLPTEAEWEKAARGGLEIPDWQNVAGSVLTFINNPVVHRRYPWGNEPLTAKRANANLPRDGYVYAAPVDSFKDGVSPYGCHEMAGNVWEWCHDNYEPYYYASAPAKDPLPPGSNNKKVCRSGSWLNSDDELFTFRRNAFPATERQAYLGVRLAQ